MREKGGAAGADRAIGRTPKPGRWRMRTIRLSDPFPRGRPSQKLEWGSSAWAADSCLVEWSRLEREWLAPDSAHRPRAVWTWSARKIPLFFWLGASVLAAALLLATCS
jgi:hypothetical protein